MVQYYMKKKDEKIDATRKKKIIFNVDEKNTLLLDLYPWWQFI